MNPPTDALELLQRLRVSVLTRQLPDSVALWLQHGVDDYLTGGGTLDECLGLRSAPGKRNLLNRAKLENRDEINPPVCAHMDGSAWSQAGILVQAIQDLQALEASGVNLKDHRNRALIPKSLGGSRLKYLAELHRCQLDVPQSQAQLHRILSGGRD